VQENMDIGGSRGGVALKGYGRPPRRFPSGRVCATHDCGTCLSVYNAGCYCSQHTPDVRARSRSKKNV